MDLSKSFAQLSLPGQFYLSYSESESATGSATPPNDDISGPRVRVRAEAGIDARTRLGPLQGEPILEKDIPEDFLMKDLWQIFAEDDAGEEEDGREKREVGQRCRRRLYVSTVNPEKSNWLRYMRPAPNRRARNVAAIVEGDQLYFVTVRDLKRDEELLYWIDDPDLVWTKKRAEKKSKAFPCPPAVRGFTLGRIQFSCIAPVPSLADCGGCNVRFSHPLHYRMHCTVFHDLQFSLTIRKYHCKVCGLAVLGKENIVKHATTEHDGKGAYQCQYCKKVIVKCRAQAYHWFFMELSFL